MADDEQLPDTMVYLSASALIWLFGVLVFLPLAEEIDREGLSLLVALFIFSACSLFLIKGARGLGQALEVATRIITEKYTQARGVRSLKKTRKRMKVALEAGAIAIFYLIYSPLLSRFHPAINGVALIITGLGIFWTLLKGV